MQAYQIVLIVIAAVAVLLFLFAYLSVSAVFGRRCDKNPLIKYFTADDFNLSAKPVSVTDKLKGYIYSDGTVEANGQLVVFCHGMGPGHIAYTTEIARFCKSGFSVLAVDNFGCNFSGGKRMKGLYSGVITAINSVKYAKTLNYSKIYLVGHSWGAYSALCASAKCSVDGVVAISAPVSPVKMLLSSASKILSLPVSAILAPFWWLTEFVKYGFKGNTNAARCAKVNGTKTLIVHGDKDGMVDLKTSAYGHVSGSNVTKYLAEGKGHNPYNTVQAEAELAHLSQMLRSGVKDFSNFDFVAATEEDEQFMSAIIEFLQK